MKCKDEQQIIFSFILFLYSWLELKPLHSQGKIKIKNAINDAYIKCDNSIKKIINKWFSDHMYEFESYSPSPSSIISTPKIISKVSSINRAMQNIKNELTIHLRDSYWVASPRTRWLDMSQCFRLNALEYYPDELDVFVSVLFPGARRWLIEQEKTLEELENEDEDIESDDTEEDEEGNAVNPTIEEEEGDSDDEEVVNNVVSGQYFRNLMQEVHVLQPSTLCGFGCVSHHGTTHGMDAFHFTKHVQLFTESTKDGKRRKPRPLPVWLNEAEMQMRDSLLERVTLAYEACSKSLCN